MKRLQRQIIFFDETRIKADENENLADGLMIGVTNVNILGIRIRNKLIICFFAYLKK